MNYCFTFLLLATVNISNAKFEFDNVKCVARDPNFVSFEYCFLKSVNRTYKYLSIKTHFLQLPIDNGRLTVRVSKRNNKSPFQQLSASVDACRFLKERSNPVANLIFNSYKDYTNINHTCPFDHDIYMDKLPVQHLNTFIQTLLPDGRYYMASIWSVNNITRLEINVFFSKS